MINGKNPPNRFLNLLILIVCMGLLLFSCRDRQTAMVLEPSYGSLHIKTFPERVRIYLNDERLKGDSPFYLLKIKPGEHLIRVVPLSALYKPKEIITTVLPGKTNRVSIELESNYGSMHVSVIPHNVKIKIYLDNILTTGKNPFYLPEIKPGEHIFRIEPLTTQYKSKEIKATIYPNKIHQIAIELEPDFGWLFVSSIPQKLKVSVAGPNGTRNNSITPARLDLPPGNYEVTLSGNSKSHQKSKYKVEILSGKETVLKNISLAVKYGDLNILTHPDSADIYLDNQYRGKSHLYLSEIQAGEHQLTIRSPQKISGRPKYQQKSMKVTVTGGKKSEIRVRLKPNFGTLNITTPHPLAILIVRSQTKSGIVKKMTAPVNLDLIPGRYTIQFTCKPIYEDTIKTVDIDAGQTIELSNITLHPIPFIKENFVRIPAGPVKIGSIQGGPREKPVHQIKLNEYWISKHEVTQKEYKKFLLATGYDPPTGDRYCNWQFDNRDDHPVNCVSWQDASVYVKWLTKTNEYKLEFRLPTEVEWEKAARGPDNHAYPWGSEWDGKKANFSDRNSPKIIKDNSTNDGYATTAPIKQYKNGRSYYGLYDMAGNIWEWTSSLYCPYPYKISNGCEKKNSKAHRVIRGGAWSSFPEYLQSYVRDKRPPKGRFDDIGFRLIVSAKKN